MSSRNDRGSIAIAASAIALALMSVMINPNAEAGVATPTAAADEEPKVLERQQVPASGPAKGTYQLRCWQQGRLVFEENGVHFDLDDKRYGVKLGGTDRRGDRVVVADTFNATCLIRAEPRDGRAGR